MKEKSKLKKCLYGIKQSPRVWNNKFNAFLLKFWLTRPLLTLACTSVARGGIYHHSHLGWRRTGWQYKQQCYLWHYYLLEKLLCALKIAWQFLCNAITPSRLLCWDGNPKRPFQTKSLCQSSYIYFVHSKTVHHGIGSPKTFISWSMLPPYHLYVTNNKN